METQSPVIDLKEALKIVGCSKSHWFDYVRKEGLIKPISHGKKKVRYLLTDVVALAEKGYR